jgi:hypothetical protein
MQTQWSYLYCCAIPLVYLPLLAHTSKIVLKIDRLPLARLLLVVSMAKKRTGIVGDGKSTRALTDTFLAISRASAYLVPFLTAHFCRTTSPSNTPLRHGEQYLGHRATHYGGAYNEYN